jgi:hypothetical protein
MIAVGFWALATAQPIGWVHPEIDAASKARLESVLRDTGEARTLVP